MAPAFAFGIMPIGNDPMLKHLKGCTHMQPIRDASTPPPRITTAPRGDALPALPSSTLAKFRFVGVCPYCFAKHGSKAEFTACRISNTEGGV